NKIVSPTHDAVAPAVATSQIGSGLAPPPMLVFHSLPCALKPSHRPSDDQNGDQAPPEPSTSRTSTELRRRTYSERFPARLATKARVSPFGEIAKGSASVTIASVRSGGNTMSRRVVCAPVARLAK